MNVLAHYCSFLGAAVALVGFPCGTISVVLSAIRYQQTELLLVAALFALVTVFVITYVLYARCHWALAIAVSKRGLVVRGVLWYRATIPWEHVKGVGRWPTSPFRVGPLLGLRSPGLRISLARQYGGFVECGLGFGVATLRDLGEEIEARVSKQGKARDNGGGH